MVSDPFGKVVGDLSQTDAVKFIVKNKLLFSDKLCKKLSDLNLGNSPVVSIVGIEIYYSTNFE